MIDESEFKRKNMSKTNRNQPRNPSIEELQSEIDKSIAYYGSGEKGTARTVLLRIYRQLPKDKEVLLGSSGRCSAPLARTMQLSFALMKSLNKSLFQLEVQWGAFILCGTQLVTMKPSMS